MVKARTNFQKEQRLHLVMTFSSQHAVAHLSFKDEPLLTRRLRETMRRVFNFIKESLETTLP